MRLRNTVSFTNTQLLPTFDYTVTLLNRIKAQDSITKRDVWHTTVVRNCFFEVTTVRQAQGNNVSMGGAYKCLIPKQENYLPYHLWVKSPDNNLTFSEGDYIIRGELAEDEIVTPESVVKIVRQHKPDAFQIRTFTDRTGTIELAEHYDVEGV